MSEPKMRFQTFKAGTIGDNKKQEEEPLLPTGMQNNSESDDPYHADDGGNYMLPHPSHDYVNRQDTPTLTKNRPVADDNEALFPIGVNPKKQN